MLERLRPANRRRHIPRLALGAAAALAAVLAVVLFVPRQQEDVQARALEALGGPDSILHLQLEIFSSLPGTAGTTRREVWYDATRRRARWTDFGEFGDAFSETLVEPGRFERLLRPMQTRIVGTSCRAFAAGCAELIDPVTRYRESLARAEVRFVPVSVAGRPSYRLQLPLQGRLDQLVIVDRQTLLPRSIRWRERQRNGGFFYVATIDLTDAELLDRDDATDVFQLPMGGPTVHVQPAGRKLGERELTAGEARTSAPYWLGPNGLSALRELRYANGTVTVAEYGSTQVWTFGDAVPPELLASRLVETKTLVVGGRGATFFTNGIRLFVVIEGNPSVALVAPQATKEDSISVARRLRRLR